ncbi:hypothetical protein HDU67_000199 [Dinochytrium kinnereticum]|nr:hypothetical protein HDU67_000199 [Dinochytrium kinnereticum]
MHLLRSSIALLAALASVVNAQLCERVVDDMKAPLTRFSDMYRDVRPINLLGGDYGVDSGSRLAFRGDRYEVIPGYNPAAITAEDSEPWVHPVEPIVGNYFFFKFAWDDFFDICYDLSPFQYLYINMSMPEGADGYITLTTKAPSCDRRVMDSTYQKFSNYIPADGRPHIARLDLKNEYGRTYNDSGPNDFVHNKDITFVAMTPNVSFNFYYISLVGPCDRLGGVNSTAITALPFQTTSTVVTSTALPSTVPTVATGGITTTAAGASAGSSATAQASTTASRSGAVGQQQVGFLAAFGAVIGALALF